MRRALETTAVQEFMQWFGLLGAPLAWTVQLVVGFGVTEARCEPGGSRWGVSVDTWEITLMIAAGAYWANRTWGSYWSWDPKETWAAITWLVYAGYLHMRITRGWRGRRAAYFAILGFGVVMFTFFGVTYLLSGLHAYA